jgi:hypothetical protein
VRVLVVVLIRRLTSFGGDMTFRTGAVAAGPPPPPPPPPAPSFVGVRLAASALAINGKLVRVPLLCPVGPCTGTVVLRTASAKKPVTLGSARFTIAGDKSATVTVKLTAAALRLLAKRPTLKSLAGLTASSNGVTKRSSQTATLKLKRRKRR